MKKNFILKNVKYWRSIPMIYFNCLTNFIKNFSWWTSNSRWNLSTKNWIGNLFESFERFCQILFMNSSMLILSFDSFKNLLFENLFSDQTKSSGEHLESLNEICRREIYLRCCQSISTYLSSALNRFQYEVFLHFYQRKFFKRSSIIFTNYFNISSD